MTKINFYENDCRIVLKNLCDQGVLFDSVVSDPPYHLESIVKRFDSKSAAPVKQGTDGRFSRASQRFIGKEWDGTDDTGIQIAFDPEFWKIVLSVMKPGAFCLAFSGSRTYHLQTYAMMQAGFVIHPLTGWIYGTGMPKGHSVERFTHDIAHKGLFGGAGTLKPALEPISVAQKPLSEKSIAENVKRWGVGAYNIGESRVERLGNSEAVGRWPSNLIHDDSLEVKEIFPENKSEYFASFPPIYQPKPSKSERHEGGDHPTCKPQKMIKYFIKLITPLEGHTLDMFAGSGTTAATAQSIGLDQVTIIESDSEYAKNIRTRFNLK